MKNFKRCMTIALTIIVAFAVSSFSTGLMSETKDDGTVIDDNGIVIGYSFGGLYWDAEEYEAMIGTATTRSYVNIQYSASDSASDNELTEDEEMLLREVITPLGMAISITVDEDENLIIHLGGYTFVEGDGVSLGKLMNRLENWSLVRSPYVDLFFDRDVIYKAVKIADDEMASVTVEVDADTEQQTITFGIHEDITEIPEWDLLAALRLAVTTNSINK